MKHNWEYKRLGDVCILRVGGDKPSEISEIKAMEKSIPIYSNGIDNEGLYGYCSSPTVLESAVTISGRGTLGVPFIRREPFVPIVRLIVAIPREMVCLEYLYYWILNRKFSGNGVAIPQLTVPMIKNEAIPVPSIETQTHIVAELDKINEVIADCRNLLHNFDTLAQSLFYDYFGDPVTNPKGWMVSKVSENFETGSGGTPSKSIAEFWDSDDIPWIGSNMCQNIVLYETDGKFISNLGLQNSSAKLLYPDTLLVALVGATIGKVALLKTTTSTNQNIGFIKPNKDIANPIFLFYTLQGLYPLFLGIGNGNFKMANLSFIRGLPIILPPLELQEKFAERIEQIDAQKKTVEETIKKMQTLLDSRMDYWFN